ncbi:hypothetical protein [Labrys monachus]|uniref:Uncharacterized protein n=1 Tax=Labrys monachus TaxID=217067 RepID=A0ABU0FMH9_9HYPH|nr:hypothetical protein [Labrys monachus]MDQ0395298.1 hypothetical protein [Labrys monachus]
MKYMSSPDFMASAEMFSQVPRQGWAKMSGAPKKYRRFGNLALAIQFAIEARPGDLNGIMIRTDGGEFTGSAIQSLYESSDYPLARK